MKPSILAFLFALSAINLHSQSSLKGYRGLYSEPGISPDGSKIAFVSGSDIWEVASAGGEAHLLVTNEADESRPMYSPDGKYLAFISTRTGRGDIYLLSFSDGSVKRLTYDDTQDELSGWSPDSRSVYFHSGSQDIGSMYDILRVGIDGGTPLAVTGDRYASEFFGAPSPDNTLLAFSGRGMSGRQWWRNGSSHLDQAEIWLFKLSSKSNKATEYRQLTETGARDAWPMWNSNSKEVFFISDRGGAQNIWSRTLDGASRQLSSFSNSRVLWPTIDKSASNIVFEREYGIWKFNIITRDVKQLEITLTGINSGPSPKHLRETGNFNGLALSPDGKKIAFLSRSHVFVTGTQGGETFAVTKGSGIESSICWNATGDAIVYRSYRAGKYNLYQYDFKQQNEKQLTTEGDDDNPLYSPDGTSIAYYRNGRELRLLNIKTGTDRLLVAGYFGKISFYTESSMAWSPDSRQLAYLSFGDKALQNVSVVSVNGGKPVQLSFLANSSAGDLCWSPNGKSIFFISSQRTEDVKLARIDLQPVIPSYKEDELMDLFRDKQGKDVVAIPADKKIKPDSIRIITKGISERLSFLPLGISANNLRLSNDGKQVLITSNVASQQHLFTYPVDPDVTAPSLKQLTSSPGGKSFAVFSPDDKTVYYLEGGRISSINVDSRTVKPVSATAEADVDFAEEKMTVFRQAWKTIDEGFYDSAFHKKDWNKVYNDYSKYIPLVRTPSELYRVLNLMVGELNASHSGVSAGNASNDFPTGRLGVRFDRDLMDRTGQFRITEVISQGPADITGRIKVGDYLLSVNNQVLGKNTNLDALLENTVGEKVSLSVGDGRINNPVTITVSPVDVLTEKRFLYRQWVNDQREYVEKVSGGKLGYVHMFDMSAQSLDQLYIDLDANNINRKGVVIDVRNNNGGFVNAYALDVFSRQGYLTMTPRGLPSAPGRTQLGQRSFGAPTILVTNQHSLSDAEDFAEGYLSMKLGTVVGEPTSGWIIYTTSVKLVDGSTIRLPFIRVTDHEGKDMELTPRRVDIPVERPIGESYSGTSSQLDAAVKELLKEIK